MMADYNKPAAISVAQAVTYTGLSSSTLYRLMSTNELPSLKVGSRRLIRVEDLEALLSFAAEKDAAND